MMDSSLFNLGEDKSIYALPNGILLVHGWLSA